MSFSSLTLKYFFSEILRQCPLKYIFVMKNTFKTLIPQLHVLNDVVPRFSPFLPIHCFCLPNIAKIHYIFAVEKYENYGA